MNRFASGDELDKRFLEENSIDEIKKQIFNTRSEKFIREELLEKYINGEFSEVLLTRTFIPDSGVDCYLNNYLVTTKPTIDKIEKDIYIVKNVINLPKNLSALQLLLNGRFSNILGTWLDYDEPIQYFEAIKEAQVSSEELEKIINYGLLDEKYKGQINDSIDTTSKILQKVKQYGKVNKIVAYLLLFIYFVIISLVLEK